MQVRVLRNYFLFIVAVTAFFWNVRTQAAESSDTVVLYKYVELSLPADKYSVQMSKFYIGRRDFKDFEEYLKANHIIYRNLSQSLTINGFPPTIRPQVKEFPHGSTFVVYSGKDVDIYKVINATTEPAHPQIFVPKWNHLNILICSRGSRFDGYGTEFTIELPSLSGLQSMEAVIGLLNNAMNSAIEYCRGDFNTRFDVHPDASSRFFAKIDVPNWADVISATKKLDANQWQITSNSVAAAVQREKQQTSQREAAQAASKREAEDARQESQVAANRRAKLTAEAPPMPQRLWGLTERVACKLAMADLAEQPTPLHTTNYCPGGHIYEFSHCAGFLSNLAQGWAQISIPVTFRGCYGKELSGRVDYKFHHYDQGWRMSR